MKPTQAELQKTWQEHAEVPDAVSPMPHHGDLRKRTFLSRRAAYRSRSPDRRHG